MSERPVSRNLSATGRVKRERRGQVGPFGSLSWARSLLGRPIALERRDGKLHVALVERRRSPERREADALNALRSELHARLIAGNVDEAARHMRHLVFVLDALGRGWEAVGQLPSKVLDKATMQAHRLVIEEPSPLLAEMIDRLRLLKVAAEVREDKSPAAARTTAAEDLRTLDGDTAVDQRELTAEEAEAAEAGWVGTIPQALPPGAPER